MALGPDDTVEIAETVGVSGFWETSRKVQCRKLLTIVRHISTVAASDTLRAAAWTTVTGTYTVPRNNG